MEELVSTFHIDWRLLLAQMVNFGIVFLVLWFAAIKPLLKIMKQRQDTVEKSLRDAKRIEDTLARSRQMCDEKLRVAKIEANKIIEETQTEARQRREEILREAKSEVEKIIHEAKTQIAFEKNEMVSSVVKEVGDIIVRAVEKIIGKGLKPEVDRKVIERVVHEINKK
jgi:F-type H+-transporting ATPase subunit b